MSMQRIHWMAVLAAVLLAAPATSYARTYYVPSERSTIQAGLNSAGSLDTVLVAPGIYTGAGNRDISFTGRQTTLMSEGGSGSTVIDCQGSAEDQHGWAGFSSNQGPMFIQGFTVKNVYGSRVIGGFGETSLTLTDCFFQNNTVTQKAAIELYESSDGSFLTMNGCVFDGNNSLNFAEWVNVILVQECIVEATDCVFKRNGDRLFTSEYLIYLYRNCTGTFRRCTFADNYGISIYVQDRSDLVLDSCVFVRNQSMEAVVCTFYLTDVTVLNSTFSNNYMHSDGYVQTTVICWDGQLSMSNTIISFTHGSYPLEADPSPIITCCNFYGNDEGDWVGNYADLLGVSGNMSVDPQYCDLAGFWYNLKPTSPCAPANNPCGVQIGYFKASCCGAVDSEDGIDIGDIVYLIDFVFAGGTEPQPVSEGDSDCSGSVDIDDVVYEINYVFLGGPKPCAACP